MRIKSLYSGNKTLRNLVLEEQQTGQKETESKMRVLRVKLTNKYNQLLDIQQSPYC